MSACVELPDTEWRMMQVTQGEYVVSRFEDACLTTLLGSCVATCLWDPQEKLGGMNHYLLPSTTGSDAGMMRYGVNAMELLVNGMLKRGAHKARLVAKVFGGAQMLNGVSDIGQRNADFAKRFLTDEGIEIVSSSLGGRRGRRVRFFPANGRVQQRFIASNELPQNEVSPTLPPVAKEGGGLELF